MSTVNNTTTYNPTALTLVNRVLRECGVPPVSSMNPGNTQSDVARDGINDGVDEIFMRNRWPFAAAKYYIQLVANQSDYVLPQDFQRLMAPPLVNNNQLNELTFEEYLQTLPTETVSGSGTPYNFAVYNQTLHLYPPPASGLIASQPLLPIFYYKKLGNRLQATDDTATWPLPTDFIEAMVSFGKWRLKTYLEYQDAQVEQARYEQCIFNLINRYRQSRRMPRFKTRTNSDQTWG